MMNNMNNFAMNPMGFNPIPINNMGMINMNRMNNMMNNMQNLNDENVLRIKNIIQPYENKIKELEEIIRQKDFEIAVLKDKLNNNNKAFNFQNQNIINFAQMNMMIQNQNQEIYNKGRQINVFYDIFNQSKSFICYENEMTYKLFDRILNSRAEVNYNLYKFNCEGKNLEPFLTVKENGLFNGCKIKVNPVKNCVFNGNQMHDSLNIVLDENYPIKKAIKYYLLRIGQKGCYNKFNFFCTNIGSSLNIEDKTPIKEKFGFLHNINIRVDILNSI